MQASRMRRCGAPCAARAPNPLYALLVAALGAIWAALRPSPPHPTHPAASAVDTGSLWRQLFAEPSTRICARLPSQFAVANKGKALDLPCRDDSGALGCAAMCCACCGGQDSKRMVIWLSSSPTSRLPGAVAALQGPGRLRPLLLVTMACTGAVGPPHSLGDPLCHRLQAGPSAPARRTLSSLPSTPRPPRTCRAGPPSRWRSPPSRPGKAGAGGARQRTWMQLLCSFDTDCWCSQLVMPPLCSPRTRSASHHATPPCYTQPAQSAQPAARPAAALAQAAWASILAAAASGRAVALRG